MAMGDAEHIRQIIFTAVNHDWRKIQHSMLSHMRATLWSSDRAGALGGKLCSLRRHSDPASTRESDQPHCPALRAVRELKLSV